MFRYLSECRQETKTTLVFWTRNVEHGDLATGSSTKKGWKRTPNNVLGMKDRTREGIDFEGGSPPQGWVSELSGELMNRPLDKAGPQMEGWGAGNERLRLATKLAGGWVPLGSPWQLQCRRKKLRTLEVGRKASLFCSVHPTSFHDKGERFESRSDTTKHANEGWTSCQETTNW